MKTTLDLLLLLVAEAKAYREDALQSIRRNKHMNDATGTNIAQDDIHALLADFINNIGARRCADLGLYASDLKKL